MPEKAAASCADADCAGTIWRGTGAAIRPQARSRHARDHAQLVRTGARQRIVNAQADASAARASAQAQAYAGGCRVCSRPNSAPRFICPRKRIQLSVFNQIFGKAADAAAAKLESERARAGLRLTVNLRL
jgi:hypothetical protein